MIKLIAFDLDGTLTQHKTPLDDQNKAVLDRLREMGYELLMVGAGQCMRIFNQMNHYPIDIVGNYGLQYSKYNPQTQALDTVYDYALPCDRESVDARVTAMREKYGFTEFAGENTEFHPSGCVTFPILGTKAVAADKLAFDPDRSRRRAIYDDIKATFSEYTVFVGGTSSFDMAPAPYNKYYALDRIATERGYTHDEVVFVGDDYGQGGNDESVYRSDFHFVCVDDYTRLPEYMAKLLSSREWQD